MATKRKSKNTASKSCKPAPKTRKYGAKGKQKTYTRSTAKYDKRGADARAKRTRTAGGRARVVKDPCSKKYVVYERKTKR